MKVSFIFGTSPEAIKMAPVIKKFKSDPDFLVDICFTGQHQQMMLPIFNFFDFEINVNLFTMRENQSLSALTGRMFTELGSYLDKVKPDLVFVQGDTVHLNSNSITYSSF